MVPPATMDVDDRFRSAPDAPTVPSITPAPPDAYARNQPAVPDASAEESPVIVFAVAVRDAAAPNAVDDRFRVPSRVPVAVVATVAGFDPVRISMYPPVLSSAVTALTTAFAAASEMVTAMMFS